MSISHVHAGYTADALLQQTRAVDHVRSEEQAESRDREAEEASSKVAASHEPSSRGVDVYA